MITAEVHRSRRAVPGRRKHYYRPEEAAFFASRGAPIPYVCGLWTDEIYSGPQDDELVPFGAGLSTAAGANDCRTCVRVYGCHLVR